MFPIQSVLDRLERWATGRNIVVLLVVFILFNVLIFPALVARIEAESGGVGPLDVLFSFSPDEAFSRVEAYGEAGRRIYALVEVTVDVIFPVVTSFLMSFLVIFFLRRASPRLAVLRPLALVPFGAMMGDLLENAGIVVLLTTFPARLEAIARMTSVIVSFKWIFVIASVGSVLLSVGCAFHRRFVSRAT